MLISVGTELLSYRIEVDEGKGVLRKYYGTSEFRIVVSHESLRSYAVMILLMHTGINSINDLRIIKATLSKLLL